MTVANTPFPLALDDDKSVHETSVRDPLRSGGGGKRVAEMLLRNGPSPTFVTFKTSGFQFRRTFHDQRFVTSEMLMFIWKLVPIWDCERVYEEGLMEIVVPPPLARPTRLRQNKAAIATMILVFVELQSPLSF